MATPPDLAAVAPGEGPLDELLASLLQAGEVDSQGSFTLDRQKAREKMQRFQLAEPARYVLELVQAAVLRGAQHITVQIEHNDIHLRCDATPFTLQDFEQIYDALFIRSRADNRQALRHLALGASTALSLRPAWVRIEGGGTAGAYLQLFPGDKEKSGVATQAAIGLHIHIRQRGRLGILWRMLGYYEEPRPAELEILREHCGLSMVPIEVNGLPITCGYQLPGTMHWMKYQHGSTRGVIGTLGYVGITLPPGYPFALSSTMHLLRNCVLFEIARPPLLLPGFGTLVDSPSFHLDISHQRVVRNESYEEAVRLVLAQQIQLLIRECKRIRSKDRGLSHEMLRGLVLALLSRLGSVDPLLRWARRADAGPTLTPRGFPETVPGAEALVTAPLWPTARSNWVALADIMRDLHTFGTVAVRTKDSTGVDRNRPLVLHLHDATIEEVFTNLFPGQLEGSSIVAQVIHQLPSASAAPTSHVPGPQLPEGAYLAKVPINTPRVRGELGIAWYPDPSAEAAEYAQHHPHASPVSLLSPDGAPVSKALAIALPGLHAVLASSFTPSYGKNEILPDATLEHTLQVLLDTLPALVGQILVGKDQGALEALRQRTLRELIFLSRSITAQADLALTFDLPAPLTPTYPVSLHRLSTLGVFPQLSGEARSLDQLRQHVDQHGYLAVIDEPESAVWHEWWNLFHNHSEHALRDARCWRPASADLPLILPMRGLAVVSRPPQFVIWQCGSLAIVREALNEVIPEERIWNATAWLKSLPAIFESTVTEESLRAAAVKDALQATVRELAEATAPAPVHPAPIAVPRAAPTTKPTAAADHFFTPQPPASSVRPPRDLPSPPALLTPSPAAVAAVRTSKICTSRTAVSRWPSCAPKK